MSIFDDFYGPKEVPGVTELGQKSPRLPTRVGATPPSLGRGPLSRGQPGDLPDMKPTPKIPINTEAPRK